MDYFFDTSALVKLFSEEKGSLIVRDIIDNSQNVIWISDLVRTELHSAVLRKFRSNEINGNELELILQSINEQLNLFKEIYIAGDIISEASALIVEFGKNHGLRTLDSIHVACWKMYSDLDCIFVTSDNVQAQVVKEINGNIVFI